MPEVIVATPEYQDAWNSFVERWNASPYHRYEWMTAIERAYGHKATPLAVLEGTQMTGVLPLVQMKGPLGLGQGLVSLPFCDVGGIVGPDSSETLLLNAAREHSRAAKTSLLEIRRRPEGGAGLSYEALTSGHFGRKVSMLLPLEPSADALLASFKPKLRSQIKKAIKNGLRVELGNNDTLIDDFYHVFSQNMRLLGSPVHGKDLFAAVCRLYGDHAVIGAIYLDDRVTAAGIVLKNGTQAAIPWASTLVEYNRLAPNMLLYWSLISHCADNEVRDFDFGRSTMGEGTFRFKKQWGAQPHLLDWQNLLSKQTAIETRPSRIRPILEATWRRLPLDLTVRLGPSLRKYIRL